MTELSEKIQEAIAQSLPAAVAGELKDFISQAEVDAKRRYELQLEVNNLQKENLRLRDLELSEIAVKSRESVVASIENAVTVKEQILTLREEHAKQRVEEIRSLTSTVFGSNRMNYDLSLGLPNPAYGRKDQYGCTVPEGYSQTIGISGSIEKKD